MVRPGQGIMFNIWKEKSQEEGFSSFYVLRNFTRAVQQKLCPILQAHRAELVAVIKQFKIDVLLEEAKVSLKNQGVRAESN